MATHSSIFVWKISHTEKPGGLQPMGSKESDTTERLTHTTHTPLIRKSKLTKSLETHINGEGMKLLSLHNNHTFVYCAFPNNCP